MVFETDRLILRPVELYDADVMYEYSRNPNVGLNAGWAPHETKRHTLAVMHDIFLDNINIFGMVLRSNHKLIGTIGLADDPKRPGTAVKMLGYAIGEPYWGQGYAPEAAREVLHYGFSILELEMLSVYCYPDNERSRRVIEKCGFHYEGRLRWVERLFNGELKGNLCFSMTREEYTLHQA